MERLKSTDGKRGKPEEPPVWNKSGALAAANSNQMMALAKARIKALPKTESGFLLPPPQPPKPEKPRDKAKKSKQQAKPPQPAAATTEPAAPKELVVQSAPAAQIEPPAPLPAPIAATPVQQPQPKPRAKLDALHILTLTIAIVLATIAAYFSVTGMSKIFPGSVIPIIAMTSTMEAGKLIGAAWLSRHWHDMSWLLRVVLTALVTILAATNAVGVFGQLSAAHLTPRVNAMTGNEMEATQAGARVDAQNNVIADLNRRINQIDSAIEAATKHGRSVAAMELARDQRKNRAELVQQRVAAEATLVELKTEQARISGEHEKVQADIGILEYAATLFGIDRERMIQLLIFAMVLSCDPLSITLVVAAAGRRRKEIDRAPRD